MKPGGPVPSRIANRIDRPARATFHPASLIPIDDIRAQCVAVSVKRERSDPPSDVRAVPTFVANWPMWLEVVTLSPGDFYINDPMFVKRKRTMIRSGGPPESL
jgi:hypothetical protein